MLTNVLTGLNQGGWDLGMRCGELLTSLAKARVQGAAENPVGLAPEALEPGFPKCIWGFFCFLGQFHGLGTFHGEGQVLFLKNNMKQLPKGGRLRK